MFTDAYDVVIYRSADEIMQQFEKFDANVVFGAELFCNPDKQKAKRFPKTRNGVEKRYLNSGGYIGKVTDIYAIISRIIEKHKIRKTESDQKHFQEVYLDKRLREKHRIKLDHNSTIFLNIYGAADDIEFHCSEGKMRYFFEKR